MEFFHDVMIEESNSAQVTRKTFSVEVMIPIFPLIPSNAVDTAHESREPTFGASWVTDVGKVLFDVGEPFE
jgi:hypothetical protein